MNISILRDALEQIAARLSLASVNIAERFVRFSHVLQHLAEMIATDGQIERSLGIARHGHRKRGAHRLGFPVRFQRFRARLEFFLDDGETKVGGGGFDLEARIVGSVAQKNPHSNCEHVPATPSAIPAYPVLCEASEDSRSRQ